MNLVESINAFRQVEQLVEGSLGERRRQRVKAALTKKGEKAGAAFPSDDAEEATQKFKQRGRTVGRFRLTPENRAAEREEAGKSTLASGSGEEYMDRMARHIKRHGGQLPLSPSGYFHGKDRFKWGGEMQSLERRKKEEAKKKLRDLKRLKKEAPGDPFWSGFDPKARGRHTSRVALRNRYAALTASRGDPADESISLFGAVFGEAVTGRLFGKGGQKPGWKTIQKLRGSQSAHASRGGKLGREAQSFAGEFTHSDKVQGGMERTLGARRRRAGRQEIEVQQDD